MVVLHPLCYSFSRSSASSSRNCPVRVMYVHIRDSKTDVPCMLLLDSLQTTGPGRLKPSIRRLLIDIYESEERTESTKQLLKIPLLIPEVPQQRGDDSGYHVLYYIRLFIDSAPQRFNMSEGHPNFMGKDWFTSEEMESFCKSLEALPVVSDHDPASCDSMMVSKWLTLRSLMIKLNKNSKR